MPTAAFILPSRRSQLQQSRILLPTGAVAQARFLDAQHTRSYLGQLHLRTSDMFPDEQQMFAAGYLEAWMTAGRIRWGTAKHLAGDQDAVPYDLCMEPFITPPARSCSMAPFASLPTCHAWLSSLPPP